MNSTLTLNQIVGVNVKRLRQQGIPVGGTMQRGTAKLLALMMSTYLQEKYTRFVIADIEGRRERNVRWPELVAFCEIFECPLWELTLPPEGVSVATAIPLHGPATKAWVEKDHPDITLYDQAPPGRDDLAALLFSLDADDLTDGQLANFRDDMKKERDKQIREVVAKARAAVLELSETFNVEFPEKER